MSLLEGAVGTNILGGTFNIHGVASSPATAALKELSSHAAYSAFHDSAARFDKPKCHPNTRETILDRLERWMRELSDQELSLLWLFGGAGAGKSAIMQSIVERCVDHRVVFGTFFFHRADESRNNAEALFRTLAYQVATAFPSALDILGPIITNNPLVLKASLEKQALELLVRPLQYLASIGQLRAEDSFPHVFVIDGLDECQHPEKQAAIIKLIADILQDHRLPLKFIIASRPELAIKQAFLNDPRLEGSFDSIFLDDDEEARADIRKYIEDTFVDIVISHPQNEHIVLPWPDRDDIDELVWKSSGHFIFASTAMRYIASPMEHPTRALQVILGLEKARQGQPFAQLDALYTHIIKSAAYPSEVLSILRYCTVSPNNLLPNVCASLEYTPEDLRLFLSDMEAVVFIDGDDVEYRCGIALRHASFRDFLGDESRSGTFCASPDYIFEHAIHQCQRIRTLIARPSLVKTEPIIDDLCDHLNALLRYPSHCQAMCQHLWTLSPRDVYDFLESRRIPSRYMDFVLHYGDASLYAHHFKIYVELFDNFVHQDAELGWAQYLWPVAPLIRRTSLELLESFCGSFSKGGFKPIYYLDHIFTKHSSKALSDLVGQTLEHTVCNNRESWQSGVAEAAISILRRCMQTPSMPSQTLFRESAHRRFLRKRKPQKYVSSGRPMLSQWIDNIQCIQDEWLKHHIGKHFRLEKWLDSVVPTKSHPHWFYDSMAPYSTVQTSTFKDCRDFLRAIIIVIPHAAYLKRLLKAARAAIPRAAFVWFPGLARRARKALDAYVERCFREEATSLRARIEAGSVDALIEHTAGLKINELD